jgi:hypothetical protein
LIKSFESNEGLYKSSSIVTLPDPPHPDKNEKVRTAIIKYFIVAPE